MDEARTNINSKLPTQSATLEVAISAFNAGRLGEAEDVCRELLGADEKCAGAWSLMARMAALNGDLETAGEFASVACQLEPSNPACLSAHAEVLLDAGALDDAETRIREALAVQPGSAQNLSTLGRILSAKGENASALEAFEQALRLDRNNPGILIQHGLALQEANRGKDAIAALRKACSNDPDSPEPLIHLGMLLEKNARYGDALATYNKATAAHPDVAFLRYCRGKLLNGLQRYPEAREELTQASRLPGAPPQATYELGLAHQMLRDSLKALALYDEAIAKGVETADLHCNRGVLLKETNRHREALASFHRAVTLDPENVHFMNNLGAAALELGFNSEALECFRSAVERNPKLATAHNNLGNLLKDRGKALESLDHYRRSMELSPGNFQTVSNHLLAHQYPPGMDPATVHEEHRRFGLQFAQTIRPAFQPAPPPRPASGEKIRVGFLSADFCQHPVASFTEGLFRHLDREAFHLTVYADYTKPDAMSEHLKTLVDDWHETSTLASPDLAARIHSDSIHILLDLAGHTALNRLDVFCMKPAAVQATWLGYPSTTGIPAIGHRLTDAIADPPGQTEKFHTERLVRIPGCAWCYTAHPLAGDVAPLPAATHGAVTFGCFNNMAKWNEPLYELWLEILRRTPGSRLRLKAKTLLDEGVQAELRAWFTDRGITTERLLLSGHSPRLAGHFTEYNAVDIALDTFPYHGTTTTCEALWMGVPVVSLAGSTHVSRVGASLLHAVDLPHLSATTPEDYIATATSLAADLDALAALRSSLRQRMTSSLLMDAPRYAANFASALHDMTAHTTR
jgi:protein O-GlcNAc transferase